MFLLDSLMISGIQWALKTVVAAAEAEMNDDGALRDRLLEAEMQREMGEMSDEEFRQIEADLLQAIREIKERREGGGGAFAFGGSQPIDTGDGAAFEIEAEVTGDFHEELLRPEPANRRDAPRPARTRTTRPARTGTRGAGTVRTVRRRPARTK
jgi:hypothetical protein